MATLTVSQLPSLAPLKALATVAEDERLTDVAALKDCSDHPAVVAASSIPPPPLSVLDNDAGAGAASEAEAAAVVAVAAQAATAALPSPPLESVVERAKAVATQLWLLLHARQCAADEVRHDAESAAFAAHGGGGGGGGCGLLPPFRCRVPGCRRTRALFDLARRCSRDAALPLTALQAGAIGEARKLLTHFAACAQRRRAARLRAQAHGDLGSPKKAAAVAAGPPKAAQAACLVCSLVCRARLDEAQLPGRPGTPGGAAEPVVSAAAAPTAGAPGAAAVTPDAPADAARGGAVAAGGGAVGNASSGCAAGGAAWLTFAALSPFEARRAEEEGPRVAGGQHYTRRRAQQQAEEEERGALLARRRRSLVAEGALLPGGRRRAASMGSWADRGTGGFGSGAGGVGGDGSGFGNSWAAAEMFEVPVQVLGDVGGLLGRMGSAVTSAMVRGSSDKGGGGGGGSRKRARAGSFSGSASGGGGGGHETLVPIRRRPRAYSVTAAEDAAADSDLHVGASLLSGLFGNAGAGSGAGSGAGVGARSGGDSASAAALSSLTWAVLSSSAQKKRPRSVSWCQAPPMAQSPAPASWPSPGASPSFSGNAPQSLAFPAAALSSSSASSASSSAVGLSGRVLNDILASPGQPSPPSQAVSAALTGRPPCLFGSPGDRSGSPGGRPRCSSCSADFETYAEAAAGGRSGSGAGSAAGTPPPAGDGGGAGAAAAAVSPSAAAAAAAGLSVAPAAPLPAAAGAAVGLAPLLAAVECELLAGPPQRSRAVAGAGASARIRSGSLPLSPSGDMAVLSLLTLAAEPPKPALATGPLSPPVPPAAEG